MKRACRVLLVDDEPANLLALESMLGDLGCTLVRATSGSAALRSLLNNDSDPNNDHITVIAVDGQAGSIGQPVTLSYTRPLSNTPSTGGTIQINADGTYTNASNTINTSKGGGATTIGVNNQMFDAGEGAFFTFVKDSNPNFLGTDLSSTEADDADNIQYSTPLEVDNGFLQVVQRQGNGQLRMRLSAFNMTGAAQGQAFVSAVTGAKPGKMFIVTLPFFVISCVLLVLLSLYPSLSLVLIK